DLHPPHHGPPPHRLGRTQGCAPGNRRVRLGGVHLRLDDPGLGRPRPVIVVVGLSHRTAPLAVREALAVPKERIAEALQRLRAEAGLAEAMLLSTCNRVEVYGRAEEPRAQPVA